MKEGEGSDNWFHPPVSKQTEIINYFHKEEAEESPVYKVPVSNYFSPLADCPDSLLLTEKSLGSNYSFCQGTERQLSNITPEMPATENFAILMAKTVNLISNLTKDIISCINLLSSKIEKLSNEKTLLCPPPGSLSCNNTAVLK